MKRFTILTIDAIQSLWQNTILGGTTTSSGEAAGLVVVADGAIIASIWAGAGDGNAPDPELYGLGQIGANTDGAATGVTYHVTGAVGSKAWTLTGGTVANLYGA